MSTLGLVEGLRREGVRSALVCGGADGELTQQMLDATEGRLLRSRLFLWSKRLRTAAWKRPLLAAHDGLRTGWARGTALRVARFARAEGVELVHTSVVSHLEGALAARVLGLPHVWHVRELTGPGHPFQLPLTGARLGRFMAEHASRVVANAEGTAACLRDAVPARLLDVVPNGLDTSRYERLMRPRASAGPLAVGLVASLAARWKKHALFVRAAAAVPRALGARFHLFGDDPSAAGRDPYSEGIHALVAELGLADRFVFEGHVADPELRLGGLDVLVQASEQESFGRVVVEAMAAGLPVVATRGGGSAEIVVDGVTGLLVPPDDPLAMARALERLAADPALRLALGAAGRERARSVYSLEACVAGVLRSYEAAMRRPLSLWRRPEASESVAAG